MRTARDTFRRWEDRGMDPVTAGNLTAYSVGLHPVRTGWTPAQIEVYLFLAWLHRTGRMTPPSEHGLPPARGPRG